MALSWSSALLIGCIAAGVVSAGIGTIRAALAAAKLKRHVDQVKATTLVSDAAEAQVYAGRINADMAAMEGLVTRANLALASIRDSLQQLRVPEAVAALRVAGASIRLLLSGR